MTDSEPPHVNQNGNSDNSSINNTAKISINNTVNIKDSNSQAHFSKHNNFNHISNCKNNNNNNDKVPKYLHKKFKKVASSDFEINEGSKNSLASVNQDLSVKNDSSSLNFDSSAYSEITELRNICPYCKLACTKPSVLKKHIRAHTNERPYPCVPCGIAFKTKSNLYKHCRSRTHILKCEGDTSRLSDDTLAASEILFDQAIVSTESCCQILQPSQFSEDSNQSLSDGRSSDSEPQSPLPPFSLTQNSPNISPCLSPNPSSSNYTKIYKPKFHTALQKCYTFNRPNHLQDHIERIINDNETLAGTVDSNFFKLKHQQQNFIEDVSAPKTEDKKQRLQNDTDNEDQSYSTLRKSHSRTGNFEIQRQIYSKSPVKEFQQDFYIEKQTLLSPGPLLGNTRLVDVHRYQSNENNAKRPRLETFSPSVSLSGIDELSKYPRSNALQMFGGEVRILDKSGESKTMRIESRPTDSSSCISNSISSDMTSVVVRSDLHSGGMILQKATKNDVQTTLAEKRCSPNISFKSIVPNISTPSLAPSIAPKLTPNLNYLEPTNILHGGRIIPHVPGIPGPQCLSTELQPLDLAQISAQSPSKECKSFIPNTDVVPNLAVNKFLRPSSLPLKPGTFTPKCHHGITPTANTLPLVSPETPRPKKSYGQLYLNGHAYTYLGLKCSTRLFYCTLNRPQPMYVTQQHGLSMYSNWKICKEAPPELALLYCDFRHRSTTYTLANTRREDILTHSTQRPGTPNSPDSGLESDNQEKIRRIKIFDGGFESNEDYTYIRGRGRGRYVCEECGIRCKKPSMLKKHIRTHTDVRPFTCKHCAFSFKTKGNLTKHMKSKSHYKKCIELKVLPVPITVSDENFDREVIGNLDEDSSSEEESDAEGEESEETDNEEQEAAESLLCLARLSALRLPGLLPSTRPATYPYGLNISNKTGSFNNSFNSNNSIRSTVSSDSSSAPSNLHSQSQNLNVEESRLTVIRSCGKNQASAAPIDLTSRALETDCRKISTDILGGVSDPALLQTIVQTMNRLPVQGREWQEEPAEGQMLQAYITERYMMSNKLKQQYRISNKNFDEPLQQTSSIVSLTPSLQLTCRSETKSTHSISDSKSITCTSSNLNKNFESNLLLHDNTLKEKFKLIFGKPGSGSNISFNPELLPESFLKLQEKPTLQQSLEGLDLKSSNIKLTINEVPKQQHTSARNVVVTGPKFQMESTHNSANTSGIDFLQTSVTNPNFASITEDNRNICSICNKVFSKPSQLRLHINIHYFERPYRCESCGTSFRTKGHLTKHERSTLHHNKVSMTSTFGTATASNPRPFKCVDCKSAFRIHGHLAKHLRSKMHIMKLECLRKLPFGTYAEMERSGVNLNDIDTTDCDTSLTSLQVMARKLCEKDATGKLGQWEIGIINNNIISAGETSSDEGEVNVTHSLSGCSKDETNQNCFVTRCSSSSEMSFTGIKVDGYRDNSKFKCKICTKLLQSLNALRVHCFMEHNIESSSINLDIHASTSVEDTINKNTHHYKRIENCTIKELEAAHKIDAI